MSEDLREVEPEVVDVEAWALTLPPSSRPEDRRRLLESLDPRMRELVEAWDRR